MMTVEEMLKEENLEILTIVAGRFSTAGNFLGICKEKENGHDPLHIYKAQMETLGWSKELDNVEFPFAALGRWQEVANRPGSMRFTATRVCKSMDELKMSLENAVSLQNQISGIYKYSNISS
jgi:hypothetical protein